MDMLKDLLKTPDSQFRNLVILDVGLHTSWSKAKFALKPIPSIDPREMRLEFRWLGQTTPDHLVQHVQGSSGDIVDTRPDVPRRIETGDQIKLTSCEPKTYLLPDQFLMKLQFHFQMVCRACGAAGALKLLFYNNYPPPEPPMPLADEGDGMGPIQYPHPDFMKHLAKAAVDEGILNEDGAKAWCQYLHAETDGDEDEENEDMDSHVETNVEKGKTDSPVGGAQRDLT